WWTDFAAEDPLVLQARFSAADQIEADRRAKALVYGWIADNPLEFVGLMPQKLWRFWAPDGEAEWSFQATTPRYMEYVIWFRAARIANQLFYVAMVMLAAVALVRLVRVRSEGRVFIGYSIAVFFTALSL